MKNLFGEEIEEEVWTVRDPLVIPTGFDALDEWEFLKSGKATAVLCPDDAQRQVEMMHLLQKIHNNLLGFGKKNTTKFDASFKNYYSISVKNNKFYFHTGGFLHKDMFGTNGDSSGWGQAAEIAGVASLRLGPYVDHVLDKWRYAAPNMDVWLSTEERTIVRILHKGKDVRKNGLTIVRY